MGRGSIRPKIPSRVESWRRSRRGSRRVRRSPGRSRHFRGDEWEGTTILRGGEELAAQIRDLQKREGSDNVLTGSITHFAHELLRQGLVDVLRLFVYPVIVGGGRRLFPHGLVMRDFPLEENGSFGKPIPFHGKPFAAWARQDSFCWSASSRT